MSAEMDESEDREFLELMGELDADGNRIPPDPSIHFPNGSPGHDAGATPAPTTWAPVDVAAILDGHHVEPEPTILARTDGHHLLYPGRTHALHAEPEALKSWLALAACAEQLGAGHRVLYLDFEDSAANIVSRLRALGAGDDTIRSHLAYIRPDEPLDAHARNDLNSALAEPPTLAVIDGVTEAFARQALDPVSNADVATWLDLLPRPLQQTGAAVLLLDHVVKDREQRGRWAIGAQHKLAGVDVAYSLRVIQPFAPGHDGLVAIKVEKDRPGQVREFAHDGHVAELHASSTDDGDVTITLQPPESNLTDAGEFRPTHLMERISRFLATEPGATRNEVRRSVQGKAKYLDQALRLLVAEGYVDSRANGQARHHYNLAEYLKDADRVPESQPGPNRVPDPGEANRVPGSHPLKGDPDRGHEPEDPANHGNRVPGANGK